ncbi:MAG: ABC transporter ATP-binding protein, partial [Candidatus Latescibacteria bacterium]|nr:ABC transporter ATP-binding protein [bacterium]MBD3423332.1 ABC transporter ATP-binding protein [Candidatus Latescibacterota bacterium]
MENRKSFITGRKTLISMVFTGVTLLGVISYQMLPVELFPNVELPFLIVHAGSIQQSDPETMEKEAIIPLEGAVGSLADIEKIETYIEPRRGGTIFIYYKKGTDIKYAYLRLLEKVNGVRSQVPEEYTVNVLRIDTEQMTNRFMTVQVRGAGSVDRLRSIAASEIVTELESVDGIASVQVSGGREKSVTVLLDDDICEAYGLTPASVASMIRAGSSENLFVGNIISGDNLTAVKVQSRYHSVEQLRRIVISAEGPLLLKDIADISFGTMEQSSISRVNGKSAVTIQLVKDSEVNLIELSHRTREVIEKINRELASGEVEVVVQEDAALSMEDNINLIIELAVTGGFLAVLILWFFLRNIRLVLIVAAAVPVSIFTALNFFYGFGISINSLTLVGIALAVGLLVDNSIVVLENIYRLRGKGYGVTESVTGGVREVWRSVFAGTLTTVMVFLPFLFSDEFLIGVIGKHIGVSVISTLLISLAVALVLIPVGAHAILSRSGSAESAIFSIVSRKNRLIMKYNALLKSALRFPARVIILAVIIFFI